MIILFNIINLITILPIQLMILNMIILFDYILLVYGTFISIMLYVLYYKLLIRLDNNLKFGYFIFKLSYCLALLLFNLILYNKINNMVLINYTILAIYLEIEIKYLYSTDTTIKVLIYKLIILFLYYIFSSTNVININYILIIYTNDIIFYTYNLTLELDIIFNNSNRIQDINNTIPEINNNTTEIIPEVNNNNTIIIPGETKKENSPKFLNLTINTNLDEPKTPIVPIEIYIPPAYNPNCN